MHLRTDTGKNSSLARNPSLTIPRSNFPMYEKSITTCQFDFLYPVFHDWIQPGDTISGEFHAMARLQTQLTYLFDDLYIDFHVWFDPHRLVQDNWNRYQFNERDFPGQDNSALTSPAIDFTATAGISYDPAVGFKSKSIYDYFKYPTLVNLSVSTQHWNNYLGRHYNNIFDKSYRDQNLTLPPQLDRDDGPDNPNQYLLRKRGKRFDWVTSGTIAAQLGTPVGAPVTGGPLPVTTNTEDILINNGAGSGDRSIDFAAAGLTYSGVSTTGQAQFGAETGLEVNLAPGLAYMLVNDLRYTVAVQHFYENDNIGGTRGIESIKHRYGVVVPDFRLNRPEYLGGATFAFDGHIVPQTSGTPAVGTPQGNLTSFSQVMMRVPITHSFVEHGCLMILMSARSNMTYQQGVERDVTMRTRLDWFQPEFANVGNIALLNREVECTGVDANDLLPFNYNEYAYWLRYTRNYVTAEMRSNYPLSLDSRHMAYEFVGSVWDSGFIDSFTPIDRNIVVDSATADPIELTSIFTGSISRVLPTYSIPGLSRL